jgi:hypothetical protein
MLNEFLNFGVVFEAPVGEASLRSDGADTEPSRKASDLSNLAIAPDLIINSKTYEPANSAKRPRGWAETRAERVAAKEAVNALRKISKSKDDLDKAVSKYIFQ